MKTNHKVQTNQGRDEELKRVLVERRGEMLSEIHQKMRDVRTEGSGAMEHGVLDTAERFEADIQADIELTLLQMKTETLTKIGEALSRLGEGSYGYCFKCGEEIAQQRLRALPFVARCKGCEEAREMAQQRERTSGHGIPARYGSSEGPTDAKRDDR